MNTYLNRRSMSVETLETGFKDGVLLVNLLELLARQDMDFKFYKNPKLRIHMIENCNLCLKWLKTHDVPNVTISAESAFSSSNSLRKLFFLKNSTSEPGFAPFGSFSR